MNIAAITRESELLAETAAERTTLELAGNDLLVGTGELRSGPNGRVASYAKHAGERQGRSRCGRSKDMSANRYRRRRR